MFSSSNYVKDITDRYVRDLIAQLNIAIAEYTRSPSNPGGLAMHPAAYYALCAEQGIEATWINPRNPATLFGLPIILNPRISPEEIAVLSAQAVYDIQHGLQTIDDAMLDDAMRGGLVVSGVSTPIEVRERYWPMEGEVWRLRQGEVWGGDRIKEDREPTTVDDIDRIAGIDLNTHKDVQLPAVTWERALDL